MGFVKVEAVIGMCDRDLAMVSEDSGSGLDTNVLRAYEM